MVIHGTRFAKLFCYLCLLSLASHAYGEPLHTALTNPPNLAISNPSQTSAQITWEQITDCTRYELSFGTDAKASNRGSLFISGLTTALNGLVPNTIYRVKVRAILSGQAGSWSTIEEFSTQIPAMSDLVADDVRGTTLHLVWSGRYSDLPDTVYEISYGTDADATADGSRVTDKNFVTLQNLSPETKYYIKLRVRNPKTTGPWSTPLSCTTLAFSPETAPGGLVVQNSEQSGVTVDWKAVNNATSYDLAYGTDVEGENMGIMPVERNTFTLHLSPNSRYFFKVRSVTNGSTGPWSVIRPFLSLPAKPRGLNVSALAADQAVIEWQSLSGTQITRYYHFSWGTDPAGTNQGVTVTAGCSYTLARLQPDQPYCVRVRTVNESGVSPWSDPLIFTTLPAGFSRVEVFDIQHTSAKIKWPSQSQATAYEVGFSLDHDGNYSLLQDVAQSPAELKNLRSDTTYYVKVRPILAQNRQAGAWSNIILFSTFAVPPVPANLNVVECGGTYALVSWTAEDKISTYETSVSTEELSEEGRIQVFNQAQGRLTGLENNSHYLVKIRARNLGGPGLWSREVAFTTPPGRAPRNLTVSNLTLTEAYLSWDIVAGSVQANYQIRYAPLKSEWKVISDYPARSLNLQGLTGDEDYRLQIRSQNPAGFSPWSDELSFKTPPLPPDTAPSGLAAKNVDDISALAVWQPLKQNYGYHVSIGTDADASNRGIETVKTTSFALKNLTPETSYFVKISAFSAAGEGPWSETLLITTRPTPPITAPSDVKILDVTDESISLSWSPSSGILNYEVSLGTDPRGENSGEPVSVHYPPHVFTKLHPNQRYRVKVRCVNRGGAGPWSQALEAITLKE